MMWPQAVLSPQLNFPDQVTSHKDRRCLVSDASLTVPAGAICRSIGHASPFRAPQYPCHCSCSWENGKYSTLVPTLNTICDIGQPKRYENKQMPWNSWVGHESRVSRNRMSQIMTTTVGQRLRCHELGALTGQCLPCHEPSRTPMANAGRAKCLRRQPNDNSESQPRLTSAGREAVSLDSKAVRNRTVNGIYSSQATFVIIPCADTFPRLRLPSDIIRSGVHKLPATNSLIKCVEISYWWFVAEVAEASNMTAVLSNTGKCKPSHRGDLVVVVLELTNSPVHSVKIALRLRAA